MTIDEIRNETAFRIEADHDARFDPLTIPERFGNAAVVERNGWLGVAVGEGESPRIVVPVIFDTVRLVESAGHVVALVSICGKSGAYLVSGDSGQIVPCEYDSVECDPLRGGLLFGREGLEGLYSIPLDRKIFDCGYAEVSLNAMTRFIWARKPEGTLLTYDTETGNINTLPGATKAFETDGAVLYRDKNNYVHLVNSEGVTDPLGFRRMVAASSGRLRLHNSRMQTECVCDITGYIIND